MNIELWKRTIDRLFTLALVGLLAYTAIRIAPMVCDAITRRDRQAPSGECKCKASAVGKQS